MTNRDLWYPYSEEKKRDNAKKLDGEWRAIGLIQDAATPGLLRRKSRQGAGIGDERRFELFVCRSPDHDRKSLTAMLL
jgi:hypothetical protein